MTLLTMRLSMLLLLVMMKSQRRKCTPLHTSHHIAKVVQAEDNKFYLYLPTKVRMEQEEERLGRRRSDRGDVHQRKNSFYQDNKQIENKETLSESTLHLSKQVSPAGSVPSLCTWGEWTAYAACTEISAGICKRTRHRDPENVDECHSYNIDVAKCDCENRDSLDSLQLDEEIVKHIDVKETTFGKETTNVTETTVDTVKQEIQQRNTESENLSTTTGDEMIEESTTAEPKTTDAEEILLETTKKKYIFGKKEVEDNNETNDEENNTEELEAESTTESNNKDTTEIDTNQFTDKFMESLFESDVVDSYTTQMNVGDNESEENDVDKDNSHEEVVDSNQKL